MSFKEFRFGKMPTHWESKRIIDYTEIVTDYVANGSFASLKENVTYFEDPNYAVLIRLTDYNRGFDGQFVYIDEHAYNFLSKTQLFGGEIIISNVGANVGTVFKVPYLRKKMNLGPNSIMVKTKGNDDFYFYWFSSPNGQESIKSILSGSAQPKFNKTSFRNLELPIPPYKEQNAIAHILSTLDDKIEVNNQINKTLENMAQAIFKQWFVDFEFPNEDGEPYKSSGGEMVESELGMIPKGWEVKSLCDIARIDTKSIKPFENGDVLYEHYSIPALDANNYPNFEYGREIKSNKYKVFEDSILISKLNPSTKRIWLPLYLSNRAICSTEFLNYRPRDTRIKAFVYSIIDSTRFTEFLMNHVTGSTGSRQRVKPQDTLSYKFAMPNSDMLKEFCEVIDGIYTKKNNNLNENQNIKAIRDSLLPKLMSGEIRVPLNEEGDAS